MRPILMLIPAWSCLAALPLPAPAADAPGYRAGIAGAVITPTEPTWIGGYGARTAPAAGKVHDLRAVALALQDEAGKRVLLLTMDTENVPRKFADGVAAEVKRRHGLARGELVISCSHTHCGPGLAGPDAEILYPMTPEQYAVTTRYTERLAGRLVELAGEALGAMRPAELGWGVGTCGFGVNRRANKEAEASAPGFVPKGPVDHDVPVLRILVEGRLAAVLFGYACHCTTMNFQQWCGDYAGFARLDLEERHPGLTALFMAGCGADTNPLPRRRIELCQNYGRQLADAVDGVLASPVKPLHGPLRTGFAEVELALRPAPSRETLEQKTRSDKGPERRWAQRLIRMLDNGGTLPASYAFPVQVIRPGDGPTLVVLGGETVVDYSLRLKKEIPGAWVFAYCNDLCAYMPSERVLAEGGYEGLDAMVFYGHPSGWAPGLEAKIVGAVHELVTGLGR